ncbi:MAG: DUF938 domain-containing protein [Pelomonas sp.]|nr:DUF938 domain-containing protein [Roseateles sp.]
MNPPARRHSPASERNAAPILAELRRVLPAQGVMLEIASGTGQHAATFGAALPGWQWQPTDFDAGALPSIAAWCEGRPNVRPPLQLDVLSAPWPAVPEQVDAMFCANMIHIAPWACTDGLMRGAARHLAPHGLLLTYGPYFEDDMETAPSNLAFDADLQRRNPSWGVRRLADVAAVAARHGLMLRERVAMPANNLLLVWQRAS